MQIGLSLDTGGVDGERDGKCAGERTDYSETGLWKLCCGNCVVETTLRKRRCGNYVVLANVVVRGRTTLSESHRMRPELTPSHLSLCNRASAIGEIAGSNIVGRRTPIRSRLVRI